MFQDFNKEKYLVQMCFYTGSGIWSRLGSSGASHGGLGGRGGCGGYVTCQLKRSVPYGDLYSPNRHGSGGAMDHGGTGINYFLVIIYYDFFLKTKFALKESNEFSGLFHSRKRTK